MNKIYVDDEPLKNRLLNTKKYDKEKICNIIQHQAKCQQVLDILVEKLDYNGDDYREAEDTFNNG